MAANEHSDVIQWGLQLLDGDPINSGYYGGVIPHNADDVYQGHYDMERNHLENDEVIARTLQEEFSQLAVSEPSGYFHTGEEHYQSSNLGNDWHGPSINYYCSGNQLGCFLDTFGSHQLTYISNLGNSYHCVGHNYGQEEADDEERSTSCSSPGDGEDYSCSFQLTNEFALDGEVGRRLDQMIPIPVSLTYMM